MLVLLLTVSLIVQNSDDEIIYKNYILTVDKVQDSNQPLSSKPTDVTETSGSTVQSAQHNQQHTADRPPTDIVHHKSESPQQPIGISFPNREYGTSKRSFQVSWYNDFPWLEYSV